jgi:molecular chaperone GrpE
MSSKQEARQKAAEERAPEVIEIPINDKRRFTPEGDTTPAAAEPEDPPAQAEQDAASQSSLEQLKTQLKEAEAQRGDAERKLSEFADRYRRAQEHLKAETEEQRARMQRTFDQKLEAARGDVVAGLLDTLDNLKRAISAAETGAETGAENGETREAAFNALLEGVRATAALFESKMQGLGLTPVAGVGEEFNPEIHEAVEMVEVPAEQDHKVIAEYQTGYKFGDRLLRPARVRVGRAG